MKVLQDGLVCVQVNRHEAGHMKESSEKALLPAWVASGRKKLWSKSTNKLRLRTAQQLWHAGHQKCQGNTWQGRDEWRKKRQPQPEGRLATEGGTCRCSIITIGVYSAATREKPVGWAGPVAWLVAQTLTAGMLVSYPSPIKLTPRPGSKAIWGFQPEE